MKIDNFDMMIEFDKTTKIVLNNQKTNDELLVLTIILMVCLYITIFFCET